MCKTKSDREDKQTSWTHGVKETSVGGVVVKKVLIDKQTWEDMKKQGIQCELRKESRRLYLYRPTKPLETLGVFKSKVQCECEEIEAELLLSQEEDGLYWVEKPLSN